MIPEHAFRDFVGLLAAGVALLAAAGVCFVAAPRVRLVVRIGAVAGAAGCALAAAGPTAAALTAAAASCLLLGIAALGCGRITVAARWIAVRLSRPGGQAVGLAAVGGLLIVASVARFDAAEAAAGDVDMQFLARVAWKPEVRPVSAAATDAGRPITPWEAVDPRRQTTVTAEERLVLGSPWFPTPGIRLAPASDRCNCHGWVFTGGRYWLTSDDVVLILAENGYESVSEPRLGDLAIYRNGPVIAHTAMVRSAGAGLGVLVEGKWGWMGVFVHPAGESCYGQEYTFYRSPRNGHVLAGLSGGVGW